MKKSILAITASAVILIASLVILIASLAHALTSNLPHQNRADIKSTVKVFVPYTGFHTRADASVGAGDPVTAEINSLGLVGIQMEAAGDDAHILWPIPDNLCINCPIKISVLWSTNSTTTTQTATWKILYKRLALGDGLAAAATDLNTTITADSVLGTAYGLNETPQGVITSGTLSRGDILHLLAELDAVSGLNPAVSGVYFHGIYIEYVREQL